MNGDADEDVRAALASRQRLEEAESALRLARAAHGADLARLKQRLSLRGIARAIGYGSDNSVRRALGYAARDAGQKAA